MSSELRLRRGTDTQHDSFTGAEAEVTVNTTNKSVHVHDGTTTGGFELARSDLNNVDDAVFAAKAASAGISGGGDFISTITGITKANPAVVTVSTSHGYVDGQQVTITGVGGMTQVNGITFYVNVLTATTFSLYSDIALTTTVNSTSYTTYTSGGEAAGSVSAGAPISASYVTINAESGMPNERRLQAGTGLTLTDGGAGGAVSLAANLAATAPSNLGSANAGVSNVIARADHVHAMPIASDVGAVPTARTVSAGTGLSGGGALSSNITLSLNANLHMLTDVTIGTLANGDVIMYNEATGVFENSNTFAKSSILLNNTNVAVNSITKFNFIGTGLSATVNGTDATRIDLNFTGLLDAEGVQDIVGAMVESNTENGIAVTYDDANAKINFDVNDPVITLSGDVTGTATMTNLGNVTISTTIAANSVALGSDTTGNYVATITGANGISVTGSGVESAAITLEINPTEGNFVEAMQDLVGTMVSGNSESGIAVTYNDTLGKLDFAVGNPTVTLSGAVTGAATITNLANATITTSIAENAVALGTNTTGNYVATVAANATSGYGGIVVSGSGSETAAVTIGINPANSDFIEGVQDIVGGMVESNTESGIAVTYDDNTGKLNFDVADPVITVSGAVSGSATMTNLGNVTITVTQANDSVALGTNTTGNYVATVAANATTGFGGITVSGSGSETAAVVIGINPANTDFIEGIQDIVGGMVETNTESGISVTYDDLNGKLNFDVADPVITLSGDVTGSATMTNLGNVTIAATIAANSVALGTDTTGNYIATVAANATAGYGGIVVSGSGSETAAVTIGIDPANADFIEGVQDAVGGMVTGNTENGIAVTYDDATGKLNFDVADPVITLSGDVTGSATMTNLGNVTITATIAANSIELGTDTTGNYVATIAANATTGYGGITISGSGSENAAVTIGIDPSNADFIENMQDLIGGMVSTNTENGIAVTYNDSTNKLDFDVGDFTITLTGDVTGVGTVTNLANVSFATTIQPNSVELGTDTTGNYIATIAANATTGYGGIVVSGSGSETAAVTIGINPTNADFIEGIQDIVGGMVETNTESGISVTYNDTTNKLNFDVADPVITLSGDVTGSATMTNLGDVTITATIAANSVALGTDTTGNYIATIAANATTGYGGIIVSGSGSETAAAIIGIDPTNADFIEGIQDIVSGMITGNTESGIAVTYNDTTGKLDFDVADPVITLSGDVTGSATMTNLGNVTITTTIAANSIELGTDTTGNYVATIAPNNTIGFGGIVVAGSGSENAAVTIGIDKANTDFRNTVQDVAALMFSTGSGLNVTYNDTTNAITIDPNDPTITLSGDVTGSGTITNLGNVTITATIAANSVELGTDTTGNYVATITANSSIGSSGILVTNSGTENAGVVIGLDSTNTDFRNTIRDLARAILPTGLSNGITYTYNDSTNALDIDPNDPVITLAGDITGSATMTNLGNVTITATIAENSVALGTDTTGNYVATITANTNIGFGGIVVSGSGTENAGVVIGIDKSNTDFRNTVQDVAALMFATGSGLNVTYNDTTNAITIDPNDPTITITGSVIGSATMTDLGNVSISVAQANDSVTLGTHTTGNYVANVTAGTGIAVVGANVETADITISVDTGEAQFVNEIQDIFGLMLSGNTENGVTVTYDPDLAKVNFDVNDPTITLTGDVSGSIQMVDLQSVTITCTVADNSHEHTIANVVGLQDALDAKLGGTGGGVTGTLTTQDIVPTTNGAYSIGNTSVRYSAVWATTLNGTAVQAQYADLAERYQADAKYPIGTVVKLGGSKEITATTTENDTQVIGVVSENPAYLMNDGAGDPDEWLPIAMTGRVRVKIVGPVTKGQRIVSSDEPGVAMAVNDNELTSLMTVVGRALRSNTDPNIKLVECIIGKF